MFLQTVTLLCTFLPMAESQQQDNPQPPVTMLGRFSGDSITQSLPRDCQEVFDQGASFRTPGIYLIYPEEAKPFKVYCDFDNEGLWTVIQRRIDGATSFERSWSEYRKGFGKLLSNFWIGNNNLYFLTRQRQYTLRIDIKDWDGLRHFAQYKFFEVGNETERFPLRYQDYSGTAGDALSNYHYGMMFSTFDSDNDQNPQRHCAADHGSGWWYRDCDHANLNGPYHERAQSNLPGPTDNGIEWDTWKQSYSFKETLMRVKPTFDN